MTRCTGCSGFVVPAGATLCERCQWMAALGELVFRPNYDSHEDQWLALDAIAFLLTERAKTRQYWRKQLNEELREAQRAARDAYHEGRSDGARSGDAW